MVPGNPERGFALQNCVSIFGVIDDYKVSRFRKLFYELAANKSSTGASLKSFYIDISDLMEGSHSLA
jgi:hypothetical protein